MEYDQKKSTIAKIAWLYYINDYTQQQIADAMDISRTKVTRYLQKAREMGLVTISVSTDYHTCFDKEVQLKQQLGLKNVVISPSADSPDQTIKNVGVAGAAYLDGILNADDILGVAWGRALYNVAKHLTEVKADGNKHMEVVQLIGGLYHSGRINPEEIVKEIARRLNAKGTWLNTPAVVGSKEICDMLLNDLNVLDVFEKAKSCTKCIIGLGDVEMQASLIESGSLSPEVMSELKQAGAVGDIMSRFFDINGNEVESSLTGRIISIPLDDIKLIKERIAFTSGAHKAKTIIGASRGGYINSIVTDENTADAVIDYFSKKETK